MQMEGMFSSPRFAFLEVRVTKCVTPNDPKRKWNPECATKEEIEATIERDGFYGLEFYHSNYVINADQPTFYTPYVNDKLYFTFVPEKMTQLCDIYFQQVSVINDHSLLPFSQNEELKFLIQENNDIKETTQLFRQDGVYAVLTLRLSPYISIYSRSFKKITQVLSELGGFLQITFALIGLFFILDLANNLYEFKKENQINQPQKEDDNSNSLLLQRDPILLAKNPSFHTEQVLINNSQSNKDAIINKTQISQNQNKPQQEFSKKIKQTRDKNEIGEQVRNELQTEQKEMNQEQQNKISYLMRQFNKIISYDNKLKIGIKYIISKITYERFFNSKQNQCINKATQMIHSDLDICNILDKLQQIEKIKNIIFSKDQQTLFSYINKPQINPDLQVQNDFKSTLNSNLTNEKIPQGSQTVKRKQSRSFSRKINKGILTQKTEYTTVEQLKNLYNSYLAIRKEVDEGDEKQSSINQRLISHLGSSLLQIFQLSENIKGKGDDTILSLQQNGQSIYQSSLLKKHSIFKQRISHSQNLMFGNGVTQLQINPFQIDNQQNSDQAKNNQFEKMQLQQTLIQDTKQEFSNLNNLDSSQQMNLEKSKRIFCNSKLDYMVDKISSNYMIESICDKEIPIENDISIQLKDQIKQYEYDYDLKMCDQTIQ